METTTNTTGGLVHYIEDGLQFIDLVIDNDTQGTIWECTDTDAEIPGTAILRQSAEEIFTGLQFCWACAPEVNGSTEGTVIDECSVIFR